MLRVGRLPSLLKPVRKNEIWQTKFQEWLAYEEIEDAEERDKHKYVENEDDETVCNTESGTVEEKEKVHSLPVSAGDPTCAVCGERLVTIKTSQKYI